MTVQEEIKFICGPVQQIPESSSIILFIFVGEQGQYVSTILLCNKLFAMS